MTRILVQHIADGRAALIRDVGSPMPPLMRAVPVVPERADVATIGRGPWAVGEPGCWSCGFAWVAIMPEGGRDTGLECLSCGEMTGTLPAPAWCGSCGTVGKVVLPLEAPRAGVQCWSCHRPAMLVEA